VRCHSWRFCSDATSGRIRVADDPGLKPWAKIYYRFAVNRFEFDAPYACNPVVHGVDGVLGDPGVYQNDRTIVPKFALHHAVDQSRDIPHPDGDIIRRVLTIKSIRHYPGNFWKLTVLQIAR
jgi:hypothetical protein